jgi:glycosyltransferase involved in cell wall biosynthesis
MSPVELSFVIPVYNSCRTVSSVVDRIHDVFSEFSIEVILVNDGSVDDSEQACLAVREKYPDTVSFLHLARNFGEHNAVMAGLNFSVGNYIAVLDDDAQNPPEEVLRLYNEIKEKNCDVVYGHYRIKCHGRLRNLGSYLNNRLTTLILKKPRDLYLSSFKLMNRFVVDQVISYKGAFPYIDGLILRTTRNLGQIDVEHCKRECTPSNYTMSKLFLLWLNAFLNYSIIPLRVSALLGVTASAMSLFILAWVIIDKLYINPEVTIGIPTVLCAITFFAGVQLMILGAVGEYLGRLFLDYSQAPQYVVRYVKRRTGDNE